MNRTLAGVFIGIAGLLCLVGFIKLLATVASLSAAVLAYLAGWLSDLIVVPPEATWLSQIFGGLREGDYLIVRVIYCLLQIGLVAGLLMAVALFASRTNAVSLARLWCMLILSLALLYVGGVLVSPFFKFSLDWYQIGPFLLRRTGDLITAGFQIFLIVVATRFIDRELNQSENPAQ
jgi:hypothetical protein